MKKLLLGFVFGVLSVMLFNDVVDIAYYHAKRDNKTLSKLWSAGIRPGLGVSEPLTKSCTKDVSENGHGWIFINREYYNCNVVQIFVSDLVFGEYTRPRDLEKEAKACKECRM